MIKLIKTTLGTGHDGTLFVCPGVIIILQINYILFVLPWDLRAFSFWTSADFIGQYSSTYVYSSAYVINMGISYIFERTVAHT